MICASLALLHPLLSLTHWIFRSLMLPYKSSSHSANHVRCASLRSGGRRLAVRKTIEYQIGALPCTPFPAAREFAPVGSMSLDSRVAWLPCESSSLATPTSRGHYKAPLCCELLMKGLLFRALLSHRSAGGRWCRKAPKGGKSHWRWLIDVMLFMTYDTER